MKFKNEDITFIESTEVKKGVVCEVYRFSNSNEKDLGKVFVNAGYSTPLQKVIAGKKTIERFESGKGTLTVTLSNGNYKKYNFPGNLEEVEVHIGDTMQWKAEEDLVFFEICWPPYTDGRFQNII